MLGSAGCTDEELLTAFATVEGQLNSRPLVAVSGDNRDPEALTPLHFLAGHVTLDVALEAEGQASQLKAWRALQNLLTKVWRRWLHEMVPKLNLRQRWKKLHSNINVDDVVLVLEDNTPRGQWPLGRVEVVYPGVDGATRVVDVRVRGKLYRRAITRIVPLGVDGRTQDELADE